MAGPDPKTLIDPVGPDELRGAARGTLGEWWSPMLKEPTFLRTSEYRAYAVLTMCRALYTVQNGEIVSKPVAARWAMESAAKERTRLIEASLSWRNEEEIDLEQTLDFVRDTIERCMRTSR